MSGRRCSLLRAAALLVLTAALIGTTSVRASPLAKLRNQIARQEGQAPDGNAAAPKSEEAVDPSKDDPQKSAPKDEGQVGEAESAPERPPAAEDQPEPAAEQPEEAAEQPEEAAEQPEPASEQPEEAAEQPDAPESDAETADSNALDKYELVLSFDEVEAQSPLDEEDYVYVSGGLKGRWATCTAEKITDSDLCFIETEYTDSLSFEFLYGMEAYAFAKPSVTATGGKANPTVDDFSIDEDDLFGEFRVQYNCKGASDDLSRIELTIPVTESSTILLIWSKRCKNGPNDMISFGYFDASGYEVPIDGDIIEVDEADPSTTLYLRVNQPARHQQFSKPVVTSSNEKVLRVSTTGYSSMILQSNSELSINFECMGKGSADVSLSIAVPPWDPLLAKFKKQCGGKGNVVAASGLQIGTVVAGNDVVSEGKSVEPYSVNEENLFDGSFPLIGFKQHSETFFVTNSLSGSEVSIDHISVTVGDDKILYGRLTSNVQGLQSTGVTLLPGDSGSFDIHFTCKTKGVTPLVLTIAMHPWTNVQIGLKKECERPRRYKESGFLTTAGSILGVLGFLTFGAVLLAVYTFVKKRRAEVKYQPASSGL